MVMIQASSGEVAEERCCMGHLAAFGGLRTMSSLRLTLHNVLAGGQDVGFIS